MTLRVAQRFPPEFLPCGEDRKSVERDVFCPRCWFAGSSLHSVRYRTLLYGKDIFPRPKMSEVPAHEIATLGTGFANSVLLDRYLGALGAMKRRSGV